MHHQKGRVREYEPGAAKTPGPLSTDAVGEMPQGDLTANAHEGHNAKRPRGCRRHESDFNKVLGLVKLDSVLGE
jgi:hypothetical protein